MDEGLKLWREWFEWSGNPWERQDDYGRSECFFCGEEEPNHSDSCVFCRAKKLLIKEEVDFTGGKK